jgi:transcriptional regulator GlxA family with amidase domain
MALRHAELAEEWKHPNVATHLKVARLLTGLQLRVLTAIHFKPQPLRQNTEADRIERALYWFRQNLHVHPGVAQVAAAIGVSEVHLRRLFHKVLQTSPKNALQAIRMERAQEILADTATTVDAAAHMLGFADASSLARAYRQHFGQSPRGKSD